MRQLSCMEMNLPDNTQTSVLLQEGAGCEVLWTLPSGSYVRLRCESPKLLHDAYVQLVAKQQLATTEGGA